MSKKSKRRITNETKGATLLQKQQEQPGGASTVTPMELIDQVQKNLVLTAESVTEEELPDSTETTESVESVESTESTEATERSRRRTTLFKSALLVSVGNLGSSVLGMVRQILTVVLLGKNIAGSFSAALVPINNFYQLLVNGSTDGALIPVFNDYAAPDKRHEMRRVVFTVVNLILIIAVISSILYALFAPWFINVLVSGYPSADRTLTLRYSQIIFFSLVALGPFAVLLAALFALKEFGWPAFATASYHLGVIIGAVLVYIIGSHTIGLMALPLCLVLGAAGQIVLLLPGIRHQRLGYMFVLDLKHPAFRRITKLYWPIAISFIFSMVFVFLDLHLQSLTPQSVAGTTAMTAATTLIQFPIGLVAQALSIAVLPTLTEHAREQNTERFKETLFLGFRLGLLLMIPAMTGLLLLRLPIVYLIFAHGNYSPDQANLIAVALQNYAYQLPFVALDYLLIAAFYAQKNTKTPVIVGIVCNIFYLLVALPFYRTIGIAALAFANTVQNSIHGIILLVLLRMAIGPLHIRRNLPVLLKICVAAVLMALTAWGVQLLLGHIELFSLQHIIGRALTLVVAGGLAVLVYVGAVLLFKVEEVHLVKTTVLAKLGKR